MHYRSSDALRVHRRERSGEGNPVISVVSVPWSRRNKPVSSSYASRPIAESVVATSRVMTLSRSATKSLNCRRCFPGGRFQLHRLACPHCRIRTCATLPPGVPTGAFGPRLRAVLSVLVGAYRLGKRPVQQLVFDLLGLSISLGMISRLERRGTPSWRPQ